MPTRRNEGFWTVAYFLAKCGRPIEGRRHPAPPAQLGCGTWSEAYNLFYGALSEGRPVRRFQHSLKNARDSFDSHLGTLRIGWREQGLEGPGRRPRPLGAIAQTVYDRFRQSSEEDLWACVREYLEPQRTPHPSDMPNAQPDRVATLTYRILRDTGLARYVKSLHNHECQICGSTITLPDGTRYAEAHHVRPLGHPHNGPDSEDNIVCVCPNHHAELDYGVIPIGTDTLRIKPEHAIHEQYVRYHNVQIHNRVPGRMAGEEGP